MDAIRISNPRTISKDGHTTKSCDVSLPGRSVRELWITVSGDSVAETMDSFAAMGLMAAIKLGCTLKIEGAVSRSLIEEGIPAIVELHQKWGTDTFGAKYPEFKIPTVEAETAEDRPSGQGVATSFSGGVDSSFSLVEANDELTHLVFIHDWEDEFEKENAEKAIDGVRNIAAAFGKEVVEVRTNAKDVFGGYASWHHYHGFVLAAVALTLAPRFRKFHIPSSHDLTQMFPWGSHPALDHLFSTDGLQILHDRVDVTRLEKVAAIADYEVILNNLRVCWDTRQNCGRCNKCTRTIFALQAVDRYNPSHAFKRPPLSPRELARADLREHQTVKYFQEVADFLTEQGRAPELVHAVDLAKSGRYRRGLRGFILRGDFRARFTNKIRYARRKTAAARRQQ